MRFDVIKQFNKYAANNKSLIQKALTTATGVGGALIPENLEQLITDTVIRLSPELAMALMKKISSWFLMVDGTGVRLQGSRGKTLNQKEMRWALASQGPSILLSPLCFGLTKDGIRYERTLRKGHRFSSSIQIMLHK